MQYLSDTLKYSMIYCRFNHIDKTSYLLVINSANTKKEYLSNLCFILFFKVDNWICFRLCIIG